MLYLTRDFIRTKIADSEAVYQRGVNLYQNGAYVCKTFEPDNGVFSYLIDGNYGDYTVAVSLGNNKVTSSCDCPFPGDGCKHKVAVLFDLQKKIGLWRTLQQKPATLKPTDLQRVAKDEQKPMAAEAAAKPAISWLSMEEIKEQALEDRVIRAKKEALTLEKGDLYKGEHVVTTEKGKTYKITLHDPQNGVGHCSCPDFLTNRMNTCKHLIFATSELKKEKRFAKQVSQEIFPFVDIFWDSVQGFPKVFYEKAGGENENINELLAICFNEGGTYTKSDLSGFLPLIQRVYDNKRVRVQEEVYRRLDDYLHEQQLKELEQKGFPAFDELKTTLYPYQTAGVQFGLYKKSVLIGDEMGLGKTLQAITLSIYKKKIFEFDRVLVVTLASLKEQWKREIEKFTNEKAAIVAGSSKQRRACYDQAEPLFKITNYEAVLRDVTLLTEFKPQIVILDEAQRIKNFNTKTADAVKAIPRNHSIVLTGTPLENKLEDVYSIVQFLDPDLLSPLWQFAGEHFMLSRENKGKILGYRNLAKLHEKLKPLVIRRRKEEVLKDLPNEIVNNYYVKLTDQQEKIHQGYAQLLGPLLHKKFLTPMDVKRIQELLLLMRMVSDSTYLIDRKTNFSPKLAELDSILDELIIQNNRKVVIFSEWTTMTYLIATKLSGANISFVELSGKIPVKKRQALIDEFTNNPQCKVFLSTDAGGTGLNLQAADCVINFEPPWNPSKLNQRIGRVNRIGQTSKCVNVINLIASNSIEARILAGLQLKTDLFQGVFDGTTDTVEFSREKRAELLKQLEGILDQKTEPKEPSETVEIAEDDPFFLNPKVLNDANDTMEYEVEETTGETSAIETASASKSEANESSRTGESLFANQPPERVEAVLNKGMEFISGLLEMATGRSLQHSGNTEKLIRIDQQTGEVVMKFKLPGF